MIVPNKRLIIILSAVAVLLLIPFIAMQFTEEVNWTLADFIVAGILFLTSSIIIELVLRIIKKSGYRIAIIISVLVVLLLIWAELAVGIFGTPFGGS